MPLRNNPWWILIKERFPPASTLPMIVLFVIANGMLASQIMGIHANLGLYALAFLLALSFFLRLRLFDELKDYETDLKINPTRPLARGILAPQQVWNGALCLIIFEILLSGAIGFHALSAQLIAIGYSLLMYKEFFIGPWLRPHLTMYAVTHTFVSALLGFALAAVVVSKPVWSFPPIFFLAGLMYWCIFNLFEFARKTFAPEEERANVDSYSSLFGIAGAVGLSLSQALIAGLLGDYLAGWELPAFMFGVVILGFAGGYLIYKRTVPAAKLFRNLSGGFILYFFAVVILLLWTK